jgi:hypothetical protein
VDVSVGPEVELGEVVRGEVRADEAVLVDTEPRGEACQLLERGKERGNVPAAHSSPNTPIVVLKSSGGHVPCAHVTLDETKFDLLHKHLTSLLGRIEISSSSSGKQVEERNTHGASEARSSRIHTSHPTLRKRGRSLPMDQWKNEEKVEEKERQLHCSPCVCGGTNRWE